ncbi:gamma-glutamylcyclotransferase [Plectonema cf. radiosum LEGE 06105]|uniref:Gamma-glutamylcyclotransferase n=2 Tax=Plectonema TaxID=1183 RepID=A0A8J7F766_9CYAN|nr:gamma-glutamylcyclotransferase [Plectonema cf. radiosum LEGE 06105]
MCKQKNSELLQVFVYGTLKPGEAYYECYCSNQIINATKAYVRGELYALPQGYPAITQGNNFVYGYLLSFANNEVLNNLDQLEDYHPQKPMSENLYNRKEVEVFDLENHSLGLAWVYFMTIEQICQLKGTPQIDGWWSAEEIKNIPR